MRRPSNGILLLGLWIVAVLVLYVTWSPDSLAIDEIPDGQRVIVLQLPGDGVLTELVGKGSVLTLAVAKPPKPVAPSPEEAAKNKAAAPVVKPAPKDGLPVAGPGEPLPLEIVRVDHVLVYAKVCRLENKVNNRVSICYAVAGVPQDQVEAFLREPDKIWVWLEKKAGGTVEKTIPAAVQKAEVPQQKTEAPAKITPKKTTPKKDETKAK